MKRIKYFILARGCIFAAALASCTLIEEPVPEPSSSPIGFSPAVNDANTRYASDDLPATMGVFAYLTEGSGFNASTSTPNFMYNQLVTRNGTTWSYTPVKYWPTNANDKVSFFAYAPHKASGLTLPANTQKGYPSFTYTVPTAEASQEDLLVSAPLLNQNGGEIAPVLKHVLTKVTLIVKSSGKYDKEITALSLKAATNGELYFKDGRFEWKNIQGEYEYTPTTANLKFGASDTEKEIANFLLLPQGTPGTFSITYKVTDTSGGGNTNVITRTLTAQALPATPLWGQDNHVFYTIDLSEETVTVTAEAGVWEQDEKKSFDIETFLPSDLKPGDYYYSDGTWSDGGLRMIDHSIGTITWTSPLPDRDLTNPDTGTSRECIGVVFSTCMSENDKALGWTHGYVLGLRLPPGTVQDNGRTNWGDGTDTPIPNTPAGFKYYDADLDGYTKTELVKNMDGFSQDTYPAFKYVINYPDPIPTGASSWFLPAIGQLIDLWEVLGNNLSRTIPNRESTSNQFKLTANSPAEIRKHLNKAAGKAESAIDNSTDFRNGIDFLSSTEINGSNVAAIDFYNWKGTYEGTITSIAKNRFDSYALIKAVPVLAF